MCESCVNYTFCKFREDAEVDLKKLVNVQKSIPHPFIIVCKFFVSGYQPVRRGY